MALFWGESFEKDVFNSAEYQDQDPRVAVAFRKEEIMELRILGGIDRKTEQVWNLAETGDKTAK